MRDIVMTTAEAARQLDVSQVTVNRLIYRGIIKATKFGPVWQVERASVESYLEANEGKSKHDPTRGK